MGCTGGESDAPTGPFDLLDLEAWRLVEPDEDPWEPLRGERTRCEATDIEVEGPTLEISTAFCGHGTVAIPTTATLRAGDHATVLLYHATLTAPEPTEGVMVLRVGGADVAAEALELPLAAATYPHDVVFDDVPVGEALFHVHNHGANSWRVAQVEVERP